MKKEYHKPAMMVVTFNQQPPLLNVTSPPTSPGPSADFMSDPTISGGGPLPKGSPCVWDDQLSN